MWYAIVAPGVSGVYDNYQYIKRIKTLYPYCKFRTVVDEEAGWEFVRRYRNLHKFVQLYKYGNTFKTMCVCMEYFIYNNSVYYNFRTEKVGNIKLCKEGANIDHRYGLIMVELPNMKLNKDTILGNLIAIFHGLDLLGDFLDVDITIPNHSVFYSLMTYSGSDRRILRVREKIENRLGNISLTLLDVEEGE